VSNQTGITTTQQPPAIVNPFARTQNETIAAGAVTIESERAIAEVQGKLVIAQRFKRNPGKAFEAIMDACKRPTLAGEAFYSFPRGDQTVSGPSIRLAEELARCWGNIDYGLRELSNRDGRTEMEAYAWDMETNTISKQQFVVQHLRDRRGGPSVLTDQRDIYEIGANMGARRMRARILAILPADLVDAAVEQCKRTLASSNNAVPLADRTKRMLSEFAKFKIGAAHIEQRLGRKMDTITAEDLVSLTGVFQSLRDSHTKPSDWFEGFADPNAPAIAAPAAETQQAEPSQEAAPAQAATQPAAEPAKRGRPRKDATPPAAPAAAAPAQETTPAPAPAAAQAAPAIVPPAAAAPALTPPAAAAPAGNGQSVDNKPAAAAPVAPVKDLF
jgi:hypothetical protein